MKGYADPRISKYFQDQGKNAIRAGLPVTQKVYDGASLPNISEDDPVYWMRASEVDFLRAEGALAGFDMGAELLNNTMNRAFGNLLPNVAQVLALT